ncbi:MAG: sigma-70 family RNA polymerase sigma factor [Candidatus Nealsonbacteria bacterium]|nr:sigma-70 family RNA polymerase sigma factor [Candidatus Nealsonbacteria bacterium]
MFANRYDNQIEPWKAQLVTLRARRYGLAGPDLDDAQQEIMLDVIAFRYDESRSNGATERTALTALIDRRLSTLRRSRRRYEERFHSSTNEQPIVAVEEPEDEQSLTMDVRRALEMLPAEDRQVCEALADGRSIREIAQQRACGWHTVRRQVARIRQRFEALGLDGWLKEGA